jgi:nucleoside-diphosphate kinase
VVTQTVRASARRTLSTASRTSSRQWSSSNTRKAAMLTAGVLGATAATMLTQEQNQASAESKMPKWGVPGTKHERTFLALKPDGVQRGILPEVIARFSNKGYKLVALKMIWPSEKMASEHYADLSKKPFFPSLVKYFSSGPIIAMVWEGKDVIRTGRKLLGETDPLKSAPGTIRGDFCIELGRNIMHGSDAPDSAQHEIDFWFDASEICNWQTADTMWVYEK